MDGERDVVRRRSKVEHYFHLVWATQGRQERLWPDVERMVYRCIGQEAERLRCDVLALNGMPDHVHLVVRAPGMVCSPVLAKQVKGVSSAMLNTGRGLSDELFRWQDGYGSFTVGAEQVSSVIAYVKDQKRHHTEGTLWPEWEETDEAAPEPSSK